MSFPRRAALIIAHAQPTPLWTAIAWTGQLRAHAPHSMQADRADEFCMMKSFRKHPVRTDLRTATAVDTPLREIFKGVLRV